MIEQEGPQHSRKEIHITHRPKDHAAARLGSEESQQKNLEEIVIPGEEKAILRSANKTVAGIKTFLSTQLEAERLTELTQKVSENTKSTGMKRVYDAVIRNPDHLVETGKLALGPIGYAATELAAQYLDTTIADTLNAVGDAHFNAARRAFTDMVNESNPVGKATHRRTAEGALREAYDLFESDLAQRDRKIFSKAAQIEAHLRATETALLVAAINRMDTTTPEAVKTWAEYAREHHEQYIVLSTEAAKNGVKLANIGICAVVVVETQPYALPAPLMRVIRGKRTREEIFPLTHKVRKRVDNHTARLTALSVEKQEFEEVYRLFVPPSGLPSSEKGN